MEREAAKEKVRVLIATAALVEIAVIKAVTFEELREKVSSAAAEMREAAADIQAQLDADGFRRN